MATVAATVAVNSAAMDDLRNEVAAKEAERVRLESEEYARRAAEEKTASEDAARAQAAKDAMKAQLLNMIKKQEEENARLISEQEAIDK